MAQHALARVLYWSGRSADDAVIEMARTAVRLLERHSGPRSPELAAALVTLALVEEGRGSHDAAAPLLQRALEILRQAPGEPRAIAAVLSNLAGNLKMRGLLDEAEASAREAIQVWEQALGTDHVRLSDGLMNLGTVLERQGRLREARLAFERALELRKKHHRADHPDIGRALINLGVVLFEINDLRAARRAYEEALPILEGSLGPDHPEVATTLDNLGNVLSTLDLKLEALSLYLRALAIREKLGDVHPDFATSLDNLAVFYCEQGNPEEAEPIFQRVIPMWERLRGPSSLELAVTLINHATSLHDRGDFAKARETFDRARAMMGELGVAEHPYGDIAALGAANSRRGLGDALGAVREALAAEASEVEVTETLALGLSERQALELVPERLQAQHLVLTLVPGIEDEATRRSALDAIVRSRALVLDLMAFRAHAARLASDPEVAHIRLELASADRELSRLAGMSPPDHPSGAFREKVLLARESRERLERWMAELSGVPALGAIRERTRLAQVEERLTPGDAMVSIVVHQYWPGPGDPPGIHERYLAILTRAGRSNPVFVPLGTRQEIDDLVSAWRKEVALDAPERRRSPEAALAAYRAAGEQLHRAVWRPIESHLKDVRRVFIVPDGSLALVNFGALPAEGDRFLVQTGPLLHHLTAERDLVRAAPGRGGDDGLLAVGSPAFEATSMFAALSPPASPAGARTGGVPPPAAAIAQPDPPNESGASEGNRRSICGERQLDALKPLEGAAKEAEEVVDAWRERFRLRHAGSGALAGMIAAALMLIVRRTSRRALRGGAIIIVLLAAAGGGAGYLVSPILANVRHVSGAEASEANLKRLMTQFSSLHLATHAFAASNDCDAGQENAEDRAVIRENPLLLSGLALAGARHRRAALPDEDDGVLTAEEVVSIDLSRVRLAVLSACETGGGVIAAGEGVVGLRRAFEIAGAGTLITSLWPADDDATRRWMRRFYDARWGRGLGMAEAVRAASLEIIEESNALGEPVHPHYWAAFVASGDWR